MPITLYAGTARDSTGVVHHVKISQQHTLIQFKTYIAVRCGRYVHAGPYLEQIGTKVSLTVNINGHSLVADQTDSSVTADYDIFKKANLQLPNTCIESAEHAIRGIFSNAHQVEAYDNNDKHPVAKIRASIPGRYFDINRRDALAAVRNIFRHGFDVDAQKDAIHEIFNPGEGMALIWSHGEKARENGDWKLHAVAVLLRSTYVFDPFMAVSEVFAPDIDEAIEMKNDWKLAFYQNAQEFRDNYRGCMPPQNYSLWKIKAVSA